MPTVKLVVIGASGVGKTSLRGQYVSGRFSTGYRATIGADFITKTLPHPSKPNEVVTLQIWDTAGQERFSSLSTAFFRGADAALLMFDVNSPDTLTSLTKWWAEFRERAPVPDEQLEDYCCVVVGNKTDLIKSNDTDLSTVVSEAEALRFLDELVPPSSHPESSAGDPLTTPQLVVDSEDIQEGDTHLFAPDTRTPSIDITRHSHLRRCSKSRSRSSNRPLDGTLTSTRSGMTSFHTPSSSLFDTYASARSSPLPPSVSSSPSVSPSPTRVQQRTISLSTKSSSSALTITPSLFTRDQAAITPPTLPPVRSESITGFPPIPDRRPRLFFTSAKTGEGVRDVFEYIARRVVMRWEYEEAMDARTLHVQDNSSTGTETIRLGLARGETTWHGARSCCGQ